MFNAVMAGVGRLFDSTAKKLTPFRAGAIAAAPIIGDSVSARSETGIDPNVAARLSAKPPLPTPAMVGTASPEAAPMFGIRRGRDYADEYATAFIAAVRSWASGPVSWAVDDLVTNSTKHFADANHVPTPPRRSLLAAIKRLPGVEVRQDVRGRRADGAKTTVYRILPMAPVAESAASERDAVSAEPAPSSRLAA